MTRWFGILVMCSLLLGAAPGFGQLKPPGGQPRYGGTYRRPLANNPTTLDPATINDAYAPTVSQQIFDGLVQYDGALSISPALAETWKSSRDGLSWTFSLRKEVKFHTGREVTAEDVVYSFTRILDPKVNSKAAEAFLNIRGAREFREGRARSVSGLRATDRYTVQVELTEASAPFVSNLASGYVKIVPREVIEELGAGFGRNPVGTGPFKFVSWKNEEIVLEAHRDYYAGRPFLDRLQYKVFPGRMDAIFASFVRGELEDTFIPSAELERVQDNQRYQFVRRSILRVRFLGLNTAQAPLTNRLVRQAIAYSINREELVRAVHKNRYRAASGFVPPGTFGYDPDYRPYPFDPGRAKSLLAKAGFPGGKDLPALQIWSSVKSADIEREHEAIKHYLADVGIRVEFHYNSDWPSFNGQVREGKLPMFRYGWVADVPDPDNFLNRVFHSRSPDNITQYRNSEVDRLLDRARGEQDPMARVALYRKAERLILEDSPVFPLNYDSYERLFQPYVQSIEVSALGDPYIPMRKIWLSK
jgi:oligopeptide transport system substrate-binding protein